MQGMRHPATRGNVPKLEKKKSSYKAKVLSLKERCAVYKYKN